MPPRPTAAVAPARRVSFELLCRIELENLFSDDALNSVSVAQLALRDRHLTTGIVLGTLRWQGWLDHLLARTSRREWPEVDPQLRMLLRMSLYQMSRMDRIPEHALVHDAVELAKRQVGAGAGAFVNGILRKLGRDPHWKNAGFIRSSPAWLQVSLPQWLWNRWEARYGERRAREYALSLNQPPVTFFRRSKKAGFAGPEMGDEIEASALVPNAFILKSGRGDLPGAATPLFHIQDEASQLIPHLLGPVSGWRIWDACAAPGGKSIILLENVQETGLVISSDLSRPRARRLAAMVSRTSGAASGVTILDATKTPPFRTRFDAVLADVPCSGLGTLRRNPEIKWRLRPEQVGLFRSNQDSILDSVARAVRPGGFLLYSTCSTEPEENEDVALAFLRLHTDFRLIRPSHPAGVENFLDQMGFLHTFPGTHLWDGFFAALFQRLH